MARSLVKMTVYLVNADYRRLQALARRRDVAAADLVRQAVGEYTRSQAPRRRPSSLASGSSGRHDLSERAEQLLGGFARDAG
jgi:hypothetical protein